MPTSDDQPTPQQIATRRSEDDALLADLTAPPTIEDARDSYNYWQRRLSELPIYKRAERLEAAEMATRWRQRLADAEREQYGPKPIEQLLELLGVRWRPNPRRLIAGLGVLAVLVVIVIIALVVAIVVFWPELEPIIRTLLGNEGGNGGG